MNDPFYVRINSPSEVRRSLLEGSKSILQSLQLYEDVVDLRRQKRHIQSVLEHELEELSRSVSLLKEQLPLVKNVKQKVTKRGGISKKPRGQLKALESELAKIEHELAKLK